MVAYPYRALNRQFSVDDEFLADLIDELVEIQQIATDQDGRMLVFVGERETAPAPSTALTSEPVITPTPESEREPLSYTPPHSRREDFTIKNSSRRRKKKRQCSFL